MIPTSDSLCRLNHPMGQLHLLTSVEYKLEQFLREKRPETFLLIKFPTLRSPHFDILHLRVGSNDWSSDIFESWQRLKAYKHTAFVVLLLDSEIVQRCEASLWRSVSPEL